MIEKLPIPYGTPEKKQKSEQKTGANDTSIGPVF